MNARELRAMEIAATERVRFVDGVWQVPSQSGGGTYQVALADDGSTCTCEDFRSHHNECKHIIAARMVGRREGFTSQAPVIDTTALPVKPKYGRDWAKYTQTQTTEGHRFCQLLYALCEGLEELPQYVGRPRTPIADVVFAVVLKSYRTFSSRRFGSDLADAYTRDYIKRTFHVNKLSSYLCDKSYTPIFQDLIRRSSLPLAKIETRFALDSTGFSASRFISWQDEKTGKTRSGHDWVKVHGICGVNTQIVPWIVIRDRDSADSPQFRELLEAAAKHFQVKEVLADKAYLARENIDQAGELGATLFVPFKSNSTPGEPGSRWERLYHLFQYHREEFDRHYHQRSKIESLFSAIKRKHLNHVRSRNKVAMRNEVLTKFIVHNICTIHKAQVELGIDADFWGSPGSPAKKPCAQPTILPLTARPV